MQFSANALIHGGVRTFIASQPDDRKDVWCDSNPEYGVDSHSSSISADRLTWMRERSGVLNYLIKTRNFHPLLHRAPHTFFRTIIESENRDSVVSTDRHAQLLNLSSNLKEAVRPSERTNVIKNKIMVIFGTRPEAIKLAPVILELKKRQRGNVMVVSTGQHREMLIPVLLQFRIHPDIELDVMTSAPEVKENQSHRNYDRTESDSKNGAVLPGLASRILKELDRVLRTWQPSVVIVQGDTSSALLGALSAFYHQIPVAHVEAGLRTGRRYDPFPEEMHRRLITALATYHFAPTQSNAWNVLGELSPAAAAAAAIVAINPADTEGLFEINNPAETAIDDRSNVFIVGSTAIDAVHLILNNSKPFNTIRLEEDGPIHRSKNITSSEAAAAVVQAAKEKSSGFILLVTAHRRENLGAPLRLICDSIRKLVSLYPTMEVAFPVHLAPAVQVTHIL
jgi:UDP-N-acetylglucosamine 2-epimerase